MKAQYLFHKYWKGMIELPFVAKDGTSYTIKVNYTYTYKPAILKDDPNDRCDTSELKIGIHDFYSPEGRISESHHQEIMWHWDNGSLYSKAAEMALEDWRAI